MDLGFRAWAKVSLISDGWIGSDIENVQVGTARCNYLVLLLVFLECMLKEIGKADPTNFS